MIDRQGVQQTGEAEALNILDGMRKKRRWGFCVFDLGATTSDFVDKRGGAYDPVTPAGNPQPPQVPDKETPHQKTQWGADVRPEPQPGPDEGYPLPEGLRKPRMGPLNKDTGRRPKRS